MRTLSLVVAFLCSLQITAQSTVSNLSEMFYPDRSAYLIKKLTFFVMFCVFKRHIRKESTRKHCL